MADPLFAFREEGLDLPAGVSVTLGSILLAIDLTSSPAGLEAWCAEHAHVLALLSLEERDIALSARFTRLALWQLEAITALPDLLAWWSANKAPLRGLTEADRDRLVIAKDRLKARLAPPDVPARPPAVVLPARRYALAQESGRLL